MWLAPPPHSRRSPPRSRPICSTPMAKPPLRPPAGIVNFKAIVGLAKGGQRWGARTGAHGEVDCESEGAGALVHRAAPAAKRSKFPVRRLQTFCKATT